MSSSPPIANPPSAPTPDPQRTAEARAAFTAHLTSIGNSHLTLLSSRAANIGANSLAISKQEQDLNKNLKKLRQETEKQEKVVDEAARKLKELGDVQNWAEVLERDLLVVEEALDRGERGEGEGSGWVTEEEEEEDGEGHQGDGVAGAGMQDGKADGEEEDETKRATAPA